jgi:pimeloyl-ACP methyl ester carboxylesterase
VSIKWRALGAVLAGMALVACSAPAPDAEIQSMVKLAPWVPCDSAAEPGPGSPGSQVRLECSTLTVPFDYGRAGGPGYTVALVRIPAKTDKPRLLLTNPGGPGIGGVKDLISEREYFDTFTDVYTVVSFDPRGVGTSKPALQCISAEQREAIFNQPSVPVTPEQVANAKTLASAIGDSCRKQFGDSLEQVGTANVARDMDEIRKALGFEQIDYLGYSYGTFLGAVYADMFPGKTGHVVLDSAMDPTLDYQAIRHGQAEGMQQSVTAFVDDCLGRPDCPLTGTKPQALGQISGLIDTLNITPHSGQEGKTLSGARMLALIESAQYFPDSGWPKLREVLKQALAGEWTPVVEAAYSDDLMVNPADSEYLSVVCIDFQVERDPEAPSRLAAEWAAESPISGGNRAWSLAPCEMWPAAPVRKPAPLHAEGAGPVLILNTTADPATPLKWAQSLHQQIEKSTLVVAEAPGHIASAQNTCAEDILVAFLKRGVQPPQSVITCPANK